MTQIEKLEMQNDRLKRRLEDIRDIVYMVSQGEMDNALEYLTRNGVDCHQREHALIVSVNGMDLALDVDQIIALSNLNN
jgi:hypothetical protein